MFADLDDAKAHLIVEDLDVEGYHDVLNAILEGPSLKAEVSDAGDGGVDGRSGSVVYQSDPAETSRTEFAELAFERNGSYFSSPGSGATGPAVRGR